MLLSFEMHRYEKEEYMLETLQPQMELFYFVSSFFQLMEERARLESCQVRRKFLLHSFLSMYSMKLKITYNTVELRQLTREPRFHLS